MARSGSSLSIIQALPASYEIDPARRLVTTRVWGAGNNNSHDQLRRNASVVVEDCSVHPGYIAAAR